MLLFFFKFTLTNLLFSIMLCSLFIRFNRDNKHSNLELLLHSLGLGPVVTTLLLYYSFLLIPHRSNLFYVLLILTVYFSIAVTGKNSFKTLYGEIVHTVKRQFSVFNQSAIYHQIGVMLLLSLIFVSLAQYLYVYFIKILPQPLIGHDVLTYGIIGEILFKEKSLAQIWIEDFRSNGFVYRLTCAPSFSLLLTWEELVNSLFQVKSDLYFKSTGSYYGLLILTVQSFLIGKRNIWLAIVAAFALVSGLAFFLLFFSTHIDSYRILFIGISWIYLAYAIKNKDFLSLLLLGIFSGLAAFTHRIGVVLAVINCIGFFVFIDSKLKEKIVKTVILVILIICFGGGHYLFDLIWGQGRWLH